MADGLKMTNSSSKQWLPYLTAAFLGAVVLPAFCSLAGAAKSWRRALTSKLQSALRSAQGLVEGSTKGRQPDFGILLFYDYVEVDDLEALMGELEALCRASKMAGRLRVSFEGINGCLSGAWSDCQTFIEAMRSVFDGKFSRTDFKLSPCAESQQFRNLKVWQSDEVCGLFANEAPDGSRAAATRRLAPAARGVHLSPEEWHKMLGAAGDDVVLFDVRNKYETRIGRFARRDAEGHDEVDLVDPETRFFHETPDFLAKEDNLQRFENKRIMMYCTGGVRCERTSALLKEMLPENAEVYQLSGGIQRYLEAYPSGGFFEGAMHVFDRRGCIAGQDMVAADVAEQLPKATVLGRCSRCGDPWDRYQGKWSCVDCGLLVLVCPTCQGKLAKEHSRHQDALRCELCAQGTSPGDASPAQIRPKPAPRPTASCKATSAALPKVWPSLRSGLLQLQQQQRQQEQQHNQEKQSLSSSQNALFHQASELLWQLLGCLKARRVREALVSDQPLLEALSKLLHSSVEAVAENRHVANNEPTPDLQKAAARALSVFDFLLRDATSRTHVHRVGKPTSAALLYLISLDSATAAPAASDNNNNNNNDTNNDNNSINNNSNNSKSIAKEEENLEKACTNALREGVASALRVFWRSCDDVESRTVLAAEREAWSEALRKSRAFGLGWASWEVCLEYCTALREANRQQSLRGLLARGTTETSDSVCDIIKMVLSGRRAVPQEHRKQQQQQQQLQLQLQKQQEKEKEELLSASFAALTSLSETFPADIGRGKLADALQSAQDSCPKSPTVLKWAEKLGTFSVH